MFYMPANVRMQFLSPKDYKVGNALRTVRYIVSECDWKTQVKNIRNNSYPIYLSIHTLNTLCPEHEGTNIYNKFDIENLCLPSP
jgi:hypothetical protein